MADGRHQIPIKMTTDAVGTRTDRQPPLVAERNGPCSVVRDACGHLVGRRTFGTFKVVITCHPYAAYAIPAEANVQLAILLTYHI